MLVPEPLITIPLEPNPNANPVSVAIGERSIAVRQPTTDHVTLIDYGPGVDAAASVREVRIDEPLYATVLGPDDVLYGFGEAPIVDHIPDTRYVAIPLTGSRSGEVVAEVSLPWLMYTEMPAGVFGWGATGVIDRHRNANATVLSYVDSMGGPLEASVALQPLLQWESDLGRGGRVSSVNGDVAWDLVVVKSPDNGGDFVEPSPPRPTSRDRIVYSDTIGDDLTPDSDFGPNQMPVVAILEPDGSGRWIRLPDGWSVAASEIWGTVLMNTTTDRIELALLDDVLATSLQAPGDRSTTSAPPADAMTGHPIPGYVTDHVVTMARIEANAPLAGPDGRVAVLDGIPPQLAGATVHVVSPEFDADAVGFGYSIVITTGADPGSSHSHASLSLNVNTIVDSNTTEAESRLDQFGYLPVSIGWTTAWVSPNVTADCGDVPLEGFDDTIVMWFDEDLTYEIHMRPIPECEDSPLTLDDVLELAGNMVNCSGFATGDPTCDRLDQERLHDGSETENTLPSNGTAEAARDLIVTMLIEQGWTNVGGDHDVAGSATFGVERTDGTFITGHALFGQTEPVGDLEITGTTIVGEHTITLLDAASVFAPCREVGITVRADTVDTATSVLTQGLEQLEC